MRFCYECASIVSLRPRQNAQRLVLLLVALVILPGLVLGWYGAQAVHLEERVEAAALRQQADDVGLWLSRALTDRGHEALRRLDAAAALAATGWDLDPQAAASALEREDARVRAVVVLAGDGTLLVPAVRQPPAVTDAPCAQPGDAGGDAAFEAELSSVIDEGLRVRALLGRARCVASAGRLGVALALVKRVSANHPEALNHDGVRASLWAQWFEARWQLDVGRPELAASAALRLLGGLDYRWPGTGGAEAGLAVRLLQWMDEAGLDAHWPPSERPTVERARSRLDARVALQQDLQQVLALLSVVLEGDNAAGGGFRWLPLQAGERAVLLATALRPEAPAVRRVAVLYDADALRADLADVVQTAAKANPRLAVRLGAGAASAEDQVVVPLDGVLSGERLYVGPGFDPAADERSAQRRRIRLGLIGSLLILIFAGIVLVGRAVAREIEIARLKSDFVSNVSHELRTPLTTIRIMAEMLSLGAVPSQEKQNEYYRNIVSEAERLTRLINNVLDFARIEEGRKKFVMGMGDLSDAIWEVERITGDYVRSEGFQLTTDVAPDLPATAFDRDAIIQALINLMSNAVKYSRDDKRIEIGARQKGEKLELWVRDHGPGIDAKDIPHLFEKFYRGGDALTREVGGTGLGLSIVQHIVDAHEGRVYVESAPGQGATFSIEIPLRTVSTPRPPSSRRLPAAETPA